MTTTLATTPMTVGWMRDYLERFADDTPIVALAAGPVRDIAGAINPTDNAPAIILIVAGNP